MAAFRIVLVVMFVSILAYSGVVIANDGWIFVPTFLGDIARLKWSGQFNLDFMFLLVFSSTWLAWRHHFSLAGIGLGLLGVVTGTALLAPYVLIATLRAKGDMRVVLLGERRAAA